MSTEQADTSTDDQQRALTDALTTRYPGPDHAEEREAALAAAQRLLAGDVAVVDELAAELAAIRRADARVKAALGQCARMFVEPGTRGDRSEMAFSRRAGVNRLTVRDWLDKDK